jgi:hypothetical protein
MALELLDTTVISPGVAILTVPAGTLIFGGFRHPRGSEDLIWVEICLHPHDLALVEGPDHTRPPPDLLRFPCPALVAQSAVF